MVFRLHLHHSALKAHWSVLILSVLLGSLLTTGCVKEIETEELVEIRLMVESPYTINTETGNEGATKAPVSYEDALTLYFLRADETSNNNWGSYGSTALSATRATGSGAKLLTFNPTKYYLPSGLNSKMVGYYPVASSIAEGGVVSWTITGTEDIMTTVSYQAGNKSTAMGSFAFNHKLTQIQFNIVANNSDAAALWGSITSISLVGQKNICTFSPSTDEGDGDVTFSGSGTLTVSVDTPPTLTTTSTAFGDPIMIQPIASNETLDITIVSSIRGSITTTISGEQFAAGQTRVITLRFIEDQVTSYFQGETLSW